MGTRMIKGYEGTLFGVNGLTKTFTQIWDNAGAFADDYAASGLGGAISRDSAISLYYLLYAKHANDHTASTDNTQFKYGVFSTIFKYGSAWESRLELQRKIRDLTEEEITKGNTHITNHAANPNTEPANDAFDALNYIDDQSAALVRRNKLEAYAQQYNNIVSDVTEEFLAHFKPLFRTFIVNTPLFYISDDEVQI